jgi:transcriptional regulator with XRE-family HTH domain
MLYFPSMSHEVPKVDLAGMRERAGLTRREFARRLETSHTNVNAWEKAGWITKAEFLVPAASILGVTLEDLLGLPKKRKNPVPGGKLGQSYVQAAKLPRSKQEKVIALLDAFTAQHSAASSSS